jgi:hypothetical protein
MFEERYTPPYPDLGAGVLKYRRKARESIFNLTREERVAYADAIEKAIRAKHRILHMRPTPSSGPPRIELTPISRLSKYETPLPMYGDPSWDGEEHSWAAREKAVYAHMMEQKRAACLPFNMRP